MTLQQQIIKALGAKPQINAEKLPANLSVH